MIIGNPITLGGGTKAPAIFGDGSDGVAIISADTQWLAETEDTGMIVKNFESLTIPEGVTVSAGNRNCGMIVRVKGDCTIAGTLVNKMSCKTILDSDEVDFSAYPASMLSGTAGDGGDGGDGSGVNTKGAGGTGMAGRFYGGGWSGGGGGGQGHNSGTIYGGNGGSSANITTAISEIFVGGASVMTGALGNAGSYGGGGGGAYGAPAAPSGAGGTGAGTAGGNGQWYSGGIFVGAGGGAGNYGGGVIILLVGGNLTISGTVDCAGSNGGNGGTGANEQVVGWGAGGPGGGGGGGRIFICHKGDISNTGTLNVNGGSAGTFDARDTYPPTAGTAGTIGTTAVKTYDQYMEEDVA